MLYYFRVVLAATAVTNTGIDHSKSMRVIRIGFPRNIPTGIQEAGRAARSANIFGDYMLQSD